MLRAVPYHRRAPTRREGEAGAAGKASYLLLATS